MQRSLRGRWWVNHTLNEAHSPTRQESWKFGAWCRGLCRGTLNDHRLQLSTCQVDRQWDTWPSMKVLGSRFSFYFGFVVGTVTLYVFLCQVWFEKSLHSRNGASLDNLRESQQQLEEDEKVWKKERSALFNLKHPHHTGAPHWSRTLMDVHLQKRNHSYFNRTMFQVCVLCGDTTLISFNFLSQDHCI